MWTYKSRNSSLAILLGMSTSSATDTLAMCGVWQTARIMHVFVLPCSRWSLDSLMICLFACSAAICPLFCTMLVEKTLSCATGPMAYDLWPFLADLHCNCQFTIIWGDHLHFLQNTFCIFFCQRWENQHRNCKRKLHTIFTTLKLRLCPLFLHESWKAYNI